MRRIAVIVINHTNWNANRMRWNLELVERLRDDTKIKTTLDPDMVWWLKETNSHTCMHLKRELALMLRNVYVSHNNFFFSFFISLLNSGPWLSFKAFMSAFWSYNEMSNRNDWVCVRVCLSNLSEWSHSIQKRDWMYRLKSIFGQFHRVMCLKIFPIEFCLSICLGILNPS